MDWLILVLGIVSVGGSCLAMKTYLGLQEQLRCAEQLSAALDRLQVDYRLSEIMMRAQERGCANMARGLDELLSANLAAVGAGLASADADTRNMFDGVTRFIDRRRPPGMPIAGDVQAGDADHQVAGH